MSEDPASPASHPAGPLTLVVAALGVVYGDTGTSPLYAVKECFALVPGPLLVPMVGPATRATVIASQALISGAFSLTRQAVRLGYRPRVGIVHTSAEAEGQIHIPEVNDGTHNAVLHEKVVRLPIRSLHVPTVAEADRVTVEALGLGFFRVLARDGSMGTPNVPDLLRRCRRLGLDTEPLSTSFYPSRETVLVGRRSRMRRWRRQRLAFLARTAQPANACFRLPPGRVVEPGMQVELRA